MAEPYPILFKYSEGRGQKKTVHEYFFNYQSDTHTDIT